MIYSKVTSKGQTTIPIDIRKRLALVEGSVIKYTINDGGDVVIAKDAVATLMDNGTRVFFRTATDACYEIFRDKKRRVVEREWLQEQVGSRNLNALVIDEQQLNLLRDCMKQDTYIALHNGEAVSFYHSLGLLTDEEFVLYHERKRNRDLR